MLLGNDWYWCNHEFLLNLLWCVVHVVCILWTVCQESWAKGGRLGTDNYWLVDDNVQALTTEAFLYAQTVQDQQGCLEHRKCGVIGFANRRS